MIQTWKGAHTQAVFNGERPRGFPADIVAVTRRRLQAIDAATSVEDLRTPLGNRLHRLTGNREGQWSISVNDQYRICFVWVENGPENVEFVDYH
jgi:proteic killer suppression protein